MDRRIVYLPPRGTAIDAHVGARLARLRQDAGITLGEMAGKLGISIGRLVLIETGDRRAPAVTLIRACMILKISPGSLYEGLVKPDEEAE